MDCQKLTIDYSVAEDACKQNNPYETLTWNMEIEIWYLWHKLKSSKKKTLNKNNCTGTQRGGRAREKVRKSDGGF